MARLYKSIRHAARGIAYAFRTERNFRAEIVIAAAAIFFGMLLGLKVWEMVIILAMIGWVLAAELVNTVMERVVDVLKPRIHPYARLIKDLMAAAVLVSSIAALVIGIILFSPYIQGLFL